MHNAQKYENTQTSNNWENQKYARIKFIAIYRQTLLAIYRQNFTRFKTGQIFKLRNVAYHWQHSVQKRE